MTAKKWAVQHLMRADRKHASGKWEVSGPVFRHTLSMDTGKQSKAVNIGYGVKAVEPAVFGGVVLISHGMTEDDANTLVIAHALNARVWIDDKPTRPLDFIKEAR